VRSGGLIQSSVSAVERLLRRFPKVYQLASRALYRVDKRFYSLSPGLPRALQAAMAELRDNGLLHNTDYYEFGVFRGFGLFAAQKSARAFGGRTMRFYGFDSFEGLPAVEGVDRSGSMFFEGQFMCSRSFTERALRNAGADLSAITLVEGFFNDSLTPLLKAQHPFKPVGVAVIDCDLYASKVAVLRWLNDLLQSGSVLMIDDWRAFGDDPNKGQQLAFREWLSSRSDVVAEPLFDFEPHGRAFRLRLASPNLLSPVPFGR
jgi:hypothetical protein